MTQNVRNNKNVREEFVYAKIKITFREVIMKKMKGSQKRLSDKKRLAFSVLAVVIFAAVGLTLAVSKDSSDKLCRRLGGLLGVT